ncbi:hypothetical protein BO86DRAFT_61111 [Aspergillus japonicus CBS 114.51]|uniref:Uncharacterized protein n=1 Tax=Aspergillus japonicus CBS 114.51 TaxID=1448312 RepID=A0A8T8X4Z7_ASPJA|nr:hypothetical protein BO86DRAFT_61111 [Aspergillus japonicus CBS 114.51]RAH83095.1 hypothetical protein BO86DRAFT_61111 [Aspergillus japonicus CBS 114.51]
MRFVILASDARVSGCSFGTIIGPSPMDGLHHWFHVEVPGPQCRSPASGTFAQAETLVSTAMLFGPSASLGCAPPAQWPLAVPCISSIMGLSCGPLAPPVYSGSQFLACLWSLPSRLFDFPGQNDRHMHNLATLGVSIIQQPFALCVQDYLQARGRGKK